MNGDVGSLFFVLKLCFHAELLHYFMPFILDIWAILSYFLVLALICEIDLIKYIIQIGD
jgi:hypothetical protein